MLNRLDPLVDGSSGSLVLATARLLVRLVGGDAKLVSSLAGRIVPVLAGWVRRSAGRPDFQILLLDFLLSLKEPDYRRELGSYLKQVHIRTKDPPEVKKRKVELIAGLATPDNCMEIMNSMLNLLQRSADAAALNKAALAGACTAARQDETCYENLLSNLDLLVRTDRTAYFHLILGLLPALQLKTVGLTRHEKVATSLVTSLLAAVVPEQASTEIVGSVLSLIEEFGSLSGERASYLVEGLWQLDRTDWSPQLYRCVLSTAYALLLVQPGVMQPIMGRILHTCSLMPNHHMQKLVRVYYQRLKLLVGNDSR
jgi:hypothetical protein